jgi:hypothetical protein
LISSVLQALLPELKSPAADAAGAFSFIPNSIVAGFEKFLAKGRDEGFAIREMLVGESAALQMSAQEASL